MIVPDENDKAQERRVKEILTAVKPLAVEFYKPEQMVAELVKFFGEPIGRLP